jgi:uncharacterized membrane protein
MKRLGGIFLLGLATLLPAALLLYGIGGMLSGAERLLGQWLARWLPEDLYLPGMGLLATVLLVLLAGLLAKSWIGPPMGRWLSARLSTIPFFGRVYLTICDVTQRFSKDQPIGFTAVVFVPDANGGGRLGLVADRQPLLCGAEGQALVPVYFPAPFQPGGDMELLPAERLEPTDMGVERALALILSGGLARDPDVQSSATGGCSLPRARRP